MFTLVIGDLHFEDKPSGMMQAQSRAIMQICKDRLGNCEKLLYHSFQVYLYKSA